MDWTKISFDLWYEAGLRQGFIGPLVCAIHDGVPMTVDEEQSIIDREAVCVYVMRRYDSPEQKHDVEENHEPTRRRAGICDGSL